MSALWDVIHQLEAQRSEQSTPYFIPSLWLNFKSTPAMQVDPFEFYIRRLTDIANTPHQPLVEGTGGGEWSRHAIIYNLFPRVTAAFDHDGDGRLALHPDGWRETGSLLKCIALLPFIRDLGFNTVHLLPITAVGQDGKKGTLGSPYAIRNPYKLDVNLEEPHLDLTVDQLFAAFVEAAHQIGLRVILEFVLRTAAKDGDWIKDHPDWFYWIRADIPDRTGRGTGLLNAFGSPIFSWDILNLIKSKVAGGDFHDLPAPSMQYRHLFTQPPAPETITIEKGRYIGALEDGTRVRVPGAFTDWPPDDNQPPWTDVTYLRMFNHPHFNYMAYNTIRQYDSALAAPENRNVPLWDAVAGVIPHYQRTFGIDGVMIDMGHALPMALKQRIVATAREVNSDFAFWDENFSVSYTSREEGYNAVMGWWVLSAHEPDGIRHVVNQMASDGFQIPFFAAPENHNTLRAAVRTGGRSYAHYVLALLTTLPAIPFILSGFELGEIQPINTGIGFSNEQLALYPPDRLPLFSAYAFDWCRPENMIRSVRYALSLRHKYEDVFNNPAPDSFRLGYSDNPRILVFSRVFGDRWITVIVNTDQLYEQHGRVVVQSRTTRVQGLWGTTESGMDLQEEIMSHVSLIPGYVLIIDDSSMCH